MSNKTRVLFLCTGNSARSQMAEAFLRKYGSGKYEAHRAGLEPKGMNPFTTAEMQEIGIDVSNQRSKGRVSIWVRYCSNISSPSAMMQTRIAPPHGQGCPIECTGHLKIQLPLRAPMMKNWQSSVRSVIKLMVASGYGLRSKHKHRWSNCSTCVITLLHQLLIRRTSLLRCC